MNFEELDTAFPEPAPHASVAGQRLSSIEQADLRQRGISLSSTPSDSDWVSPFTLPPLPALRRNREHSSLRSPDRLRQRDGSGAYYAAAWGSPYASPSPEHNSSARHAAGRSIDSELSSPQANRSFLNRRARHSIGASDVKAPQARRRLASVKKLRNKSETHNWLSGSETSEEEDQQEEQYYTPRSRGRLSDWSSLSASTTKDRGATSHKATDSVVTVTPHNFESTSLHQHQSTVRNTRLQKLAPKSMAETEDAAQKPLPSLPRRTSMADEALMSTPSSPTRPRLGSLQSFRQKRKVPWKGKNLVINLPMTDRESFGLPPVLSARQMQHKLELLIAEGWSTQGFDLTSSWQGHVRTNSGQSRPAFPDTENTQSERKMRQFTVRIPNQREWEDWVNYLQEEKLRALGVSPSNSEAPASMASPLSQPVSRASTKYTAPMQSPPFHTFSAASNPPHVTSNTFSPTFGVSSGFGSQVGSGASSQHNGGPGTVHAYKQSLATGQSRRMSPPGFAAMQPSISGQRGSPPVDGLDGRPRKFSPVNAHAIQILGGVLSPSRVPGWQHPALTNGTKNLSRPPMPLQQQSMPRTPTMDQLSRTTPIELKHPTPRSHRHNLSATLQREIDTAEAALEKQDYLSQVWDRREANVAAYDNQHTEEETHNELPILRRPETMNDDDQSEIITNPSIAPSPLLEDKSVPTKWQALSDAARGPQQLSLKGHTSQPSGSKFNVEAKEFDPTAGFKSSNFSFTGGAFQSLNQPLQPPAPSVKTVTGTAPRQVSDSRLNVEAPAFVPGGESSSIEKPSLFRFSSATLNVEAPEFNPEKSPSKNFKSVDSMSEGAKPAPTSIFGNINIDSNTKVSRRTSKALPITRPRSKDGSSSGSSRQSSVASFEAEDPEDDEGRVTAPADRNKRARRADSDGDRSPVFADSAPFNHARILSEIVSETDTQSLTEDKPKEKPVDGWAYIPADESEVTHEKTPQSPLPQQIGELPARGSPFEFRDQRDAVNFSEAMPRSRSVSPLSEEDVVEVIEELSDMPSSPMPSKEPRPGHKSKASSVESAEPLMPISTQQPWPYNASPPLSPAPKSRDPSGLAASQWADSPSPPGSPPVAASARLSSPVSYPGPLIDRFSPVSPPRPSARLSAPMSHIEPMIKDETDEEDLMRSVKVTEDLSDDVEDTTLSSASQKGEGTTEESIIDRSPRLHSSGSYPGGAHRTRESDHDDDMQPSFEEIDAVMKQFETNPDLGIERHDSPIGSTPLVDMRLPSNFRSDAPSPSPRRNAPREVPNEGPSAAAHSLGLGIHRLNTGKEQVSDWNEELSTAEDNKSQSRAHFFDGHLNELVDGVLENRLGPLERTLETIQHSIALMANRPERKSRRSTSDEKKDSDADDEDDDDAAEGFSAYRSRSPESKRNRRTSRIRVAVAEGMAAYLESMPQPPSVDLSAVMAELADMRQLVQQAPHQAQPPAVDLSAVMGELAEMRQLVEQAPQQVTASNQQKEMQAALDQVISNHPRLRGSRVQKDYEASDGKFKLQVDGLEAMLKHEQERAEHEGLRRKKADEEIELLKRALEDAETQAAEHRESAEQAEQRLVDFAQEKKAYRELEQDFEDLSLKNDALEETLEEYRKDKDAYRDLEQELEGVNLKSESLEKTLEEYRKYKEEHQYDLVEERQKNSELSRTLYDVKDQLADRTQRCYALHTKVERVQEQISSAVTDLVSEQAEWRTRENELKTKMSIIENALYQATRHSEKVQLDIDELEKQHKEAILYKDRFENLQLETTQAQDLVARLRSESRANEDRAYSLERELNETKSLKDAEAATMVARLTAELDGTKTQLETYQQDSESRILRLQARLDTADQDWEDQKVKHDTLHAETHDLHINGVRELNEKHEQALEEQRAAHDRKLGDLRDRHTRAMHNSSDDRHRMEHQFNEKLAMSEDKVKHLESKLIDLDERLQITKSAARAAVEAATARNINLPTPANSVVASPPTRAASASLSIVRGEPEKIPVQSLRESILVLQEQLQNREQKIEMLEAEIKALDKEAPAKIKERETEVQWLRELLAVRVDDIEDIISRTAQSDFEREPVKDAAIRLRANIQMEQQIRERSTTGQPLVSALPSLNQVAAYAQSPRQALPMVGKAAWGNLIKARQFATETGGSFYEQYVSQTPSKSNTNSPASFLSGIMTAPQTSASLSRHNSNENMPPPPAMRPLAAAAAARRAHSSEAQPRPLRGYSSQPRALGKKINTDAAMSNAFPLRRSPSPHTPTINRGREMDFGDDVDRDASPMGRVEPRPDEATVFGLEKHESVGELKEGAC